VNPPGKHGFCVYVLQNPAGRFYVGQTAEFQRRIIQHNQSGLSLGKYTLKNGPWKLVWSESHPDRGSG